MSDELALLRAICADPDEDTPRLAFADYLEENGSTHRAAFIRGQVELATLKEDSMHRREIAFQCRQLLDAHEDEWLEPRDAFSFDWNWSRGFVETFTTTPQDLEERDAELFDVCPFRRLWVWELNGRAAGLRLIPENNHLTALDLTGGNLDARQLHALAQMKQFPHLRELNLMFNNLADGAVNVLRDEPFFQRLDLIHLGANPLDEFVRDMLREHFGNCVTFAHERDPNRLYTVRDERVRVGWCKGFTQLYMRAGDSQQRVAVFDHAGNLLRTEEREVPQPNARNPDARERNRVAVRDKWLDEPGYESGTIKVKAFQFADGLGIHPFNWWANVFDGHLPAPHPNLRESVEGWLEDGQYSFGYGGQGGSMWFDRTGEATDT